MREIKFRAWDSISKKLYNWETIRVTPLYDFMTYDHYTLDQFIDLADKNGKEIYEGDILKVDSHFFGDLHVNGFCGVVKYEDAMYSIHGIMGWNELDKSEIENKNIVVIGNIHQNKDLLK